MNHRAIPLLAALLRTGIIRLAAATGLLLLLRLFHISSPALRCAACAGVVLQGWLLVQYPLPEPFAAEDLAARHRVPESQSIVPNQTASLRPVPSNSRIDFGPPQALDIRMKQATRARDSVGDGDRGPLGDRNCRSRRPLGAELCPLCPPVLRRSSHEAGRLS